MANSKTKLPGILLAIASFLTAFQLAIPLIPDINEATRTLISAIVILAVTSATIWRQYISKYIQDGAIKFTLAAALIATVGGINDFFNVVHFSDSLSQWIRFVITLIIMTINALSTEAFPTYLQKMKEREQEEEKK